MKKIINKSVCDTSTAIKLGTWDNGQRYGGFSYCEESLYRSKAGKYFLYGSGGATSKYAVSGGDNSWCGGSQIITMSRDAAMDWAEENLSGDEYEAAFGVVEEEGKEPLNLTISAQAKAKLKEAAERQGTSMSALIEEMTLNKL
jgi:hypothetical protein